MYHVYDGWLTVIAVCDVDVRPAVSTSFFQQPQQGEGLISFLSSQDTHLAADLDRVSLTLIFNLLHAPVVLFNHRSTWRSIF